MQKIQFLKHHQIDFKLYDTCIAKASEIRTEAFSWYLNIVTNNNWDLLMLNDYSVVMPLPYSRLKKHFFLKKITQPFFCQQLGVFFKSNIDQAILKNFMEELRSKKIYSYHVHNDILKINFQNYFNTKNNYLLNLNKPYTEITKNYKKGLKSNLKLADKNNLILKKEISFEQFILMKKNNSIHKIKSGNIQIMKTLTQKLNSLNKGNFYGVFKDNKLIATAFFIETKKNLVYLFSATTQTGKKTGATPFLIDSLIKSNANTNKILDFEGSMIPGIASFFKSFGAVNEPYFAYKNV